MRKKDYQMVAIDKEVHEALKRFCVLHGYTINGLMTRLAIEYIEQHSRKVKQEA
jgi:hypothetical protein